MAVLETIRNFFVQSEAAESEVIMPAPPTVYEVHPLTTTHIDELLRLNLRCFKKGENYTKHTFGYLLDDPTTVSYRVATPEEPVVGFIFVMVQPSGTGHVTTVGVAPEHRRRGLAERLLAHVEEALRNRGANTVALEVRVSNIAAQSLYRGLNYSIVQRLTAYYNNGEDAFLMIKPI
ncbi:MAG: ribosomal protein S18-alanine N-acetyltransferase [Acidobacteria bacterium]|nr:ribosomal protein S18-alanine N-acetyltransferase [Acidobacteriota bacterium]